MPLDFTAQKQILRIRELDARFHKLRVFYPGKRPETMTAAERAEALRMLESFELARVRAIANRQPAA